MDKKSMNIVVLGASNKEDRYAFKALKLLQEKGFKAIPINPALDQILGIPVIPSLKDIDLTIDTVTIYMRPERWEAMINDIIGLKPRRVILNPGTESVELSKRLKEAGIETIEACTLVLLRTGQF